MTKYVNLIFLLAMVGCTTGMAENIKLITDNHETVVYEDGVTLEESKIIAQNLLIKMNVVELYDLSRPQVANDVSELPNNEDYWFIFFEETKTSSIPFIFMVVINKQTGKAKFADDYNEGNLWILEAALLR